MPDLAFDSVAEDALMGIGHDGSDHTALVDSRCAGGS